MRSKNENNEREKYWLIRTKFAVTINYRLQPIIPRRSTWSQKSIPICIWLDVHDIQHPKQWIPHRKTRNTCWVGLDSIPQKGSQKGWQERFANRFAKYPLPLFTIHTQYNFIRSTEYYYFIILVNLQHQYGRFVLWCKNYHFLIFLIVTSSNFSRNSKT
jgi:hypothetical protein